MLYDSTFFGLIPPKVVEPILDCGFLVPKQSFLLQFRVNYNILGPGCLFLSRLQFFQVAKDWQM